VTVPPRPIPPLANPGGLTTPFGTVIGPGRVEDLADVLGPAAPVATLVGRVLMRPVQFLFPLAAFGWVLEGTLGRGE